MKTPLTIAVAKGYLMAESLALFAKAGVVFEDDLSTSRKLFTLSTDGRIRLLQVRPWDVPAYVAQGAAELGIVGRDVLLEQTPPVIQLLDLKFGVCSLVIAGPDPGLDLNSFSHLKVATKYPHSAQHYFAAKGIKAQLLKLYGAIELAPLTGLSDVICDLTATGATLRENQLHVVDTVFTSSAHLVANPVGFKCRYEEVMAWVVALGEGVVHV